MHIKMRIEQTPNTRKRMKYIPESDTFLETDYDFLGFMRGFPGYYGWIIETGTPPKDHLDILLLSDNQYEIGDIVNCKVIGYFYRNDTDHKILGVESDSEITDLDKLPKKVLDMLERLYPIKTGLEGWYSKDEARKIITGFECKS